VHLTPSPTTKHQLVLSLSSSLSAGVSKHQKGEVAFAPLDVRLGPDTALQPDLIFVSNSRAEIIREDYIHGAPDPAAGG
jgi:hypothetical protein